MRKFLGILLVMLFTLVMCGTALAGELDNFIELDKDEWTVGKAYTGNFTLDAEEGEDYNDPLAWALVGAPGGWSVVEATGVLTGTPGTEDPITFTVNVTDSTGTAKTGTKSITITINPEPEITTGASLPDGYVGVSYSVTFAVTGGTAPFKWTVDSGELPEGLALDLDSGVLSGTPNDEIGEYEFSIKVTDHAKAESASEPFTLNIKEKPEGKGSSGCDTGFGFLALALLGSIPLVLRRK